ncbi:hypothetical protein H0H87_008710 [Tephrocybe sp. NHM501043]|nr:hypothetical protein H0H87_008710 [Tephrocybe sp. NHM501043]
MFTALPSDILILVLQNASVQELVALSRCCKHLQTLVTEFGWLAYLQANPRPSFSLSPSRKNWPAHAKVRYDYLSDRSWLHSTFIARPLSKPWPTKSQPVMAISSSRLIIAAGSGITSYAFGISRDTEAPPIILEGSFFFARHEQPVTGIAFLDNDGPDQSMCLAFQDGTLHHVSLNPSSPNGLRSPFSATVLSSSKLQNGEHIESLSSQRDILLSLSSSGIASLGNSRSLHTKSEHAALNARGWTSHLCLDSSGPYAAFGTSSTWPLRVHGLRDDELSQTPTAILHAHLGPEIFETNLVSTAVYGISRAPLASPWGSSPQILVSGWFDGFVRCHDLRSSSRMTDASAIPGGPAPLRPVLTMKDPLQLEPFYSVSCGGGSASHIAAGSARHRVVSFWDVRYPHDGWSVYAPGYMAPHKAAPLCMTSDPESNPEHIPSYLKA